MSLAMAFIRFLPQAQGHFNSDTPLPLAETASVFAELLVFNSQLDLLENDQERRAFICQKLESILPLSSDKQP